MIHAHVDLAKRTFGNPNAPQSLIPFLAIDNPNPADMANRWPARGEEARFFSGKYDEGGAIVTIHYSSGFTHS